jgi:hypothetical protein
MWMQGIPRSIRGKVWFLAFGNRSAITDDLFNIMADRGEKLKELLKQNGAIEQSIIVNGGEIPRTINRLNQLIDETDLAVIQGA